MTVALSGGQIVEVSIVGAVVLLGLVAFLRVLIRREPGPPRWLRWRLGVFLERDPLQQDDDEPTNPKEPR